MAKKRARKSAKRLQAGTGAPAEPRLKAAPEGNRRETAEGIPAATSPAGEAKTKGSRFSVEIPQTQKPFLISIGIIVLASVILISIPLMKTRVVNMRFDEAMKLVADKDVERGTKALEDLLKTLPHNASLHLDLGHFYAMKGREGEFLNREYLEMALKEYQAVLRLVHVNLDARLCITDIILEVAEEDMKNAAQIKKNTSDPKKLAVAAELEKKTTELLAEAKRYLLDAQNFNRDHPAIFQRLGRLNLIEGNLTGAANYYSRLVYDDNYSEIAREQLKEIEREFYGDI